MAWWHKSRSTSAQVMACCLKAPSHHLNQWYIISKPSGIHLRLISQHTHQPSIIKIILKITYRYQKFNSRLTGANELNRARFLSSLRMNFNNLHHLSAEESCKMHIHIYLCCFKTMQLIKSWLFSCSLPGRDRVCEASRHDGTEGDKERPFGGSL